MLKPISILPVNCNKQIYDCLSNRIYDAVLLSPVEDNSIDDFSSVDAIYSHMQMTELGINIATSGKPTLIEGPIADSLQATKAFIESAMASGTKLFYSQSHLFNPSMKRLLKNIELNKLGIPGLLRIHRWRSKPDKGLLYKDIDLLIKIFGHKPITILATQSDIENNYIQVHMGFKNGGMSLLDYTSVLTADQSYDSVSLIASNGAAYADDHLNTHLKFSNGQTLGLLSEQSDQNYVEDYQQFIFDINNKFEPDYQHFMILQTIYDSVYQSLESNQVLNLVGDKYES